MTELMILFFSFFLSGNSMGAAAGAVKETKEQWCVTSRSSFVQHLAPVAMPAEDRVTGDIDAIVVGRHYSRPIYGIPFNANVLKIYIRRLEIALRKSQYEHINKQVNSGLLVFVYVSSEPRLLDWDPLMEKILERTPAAVTRYRGVTYVLVKKYYFDQMDNYGRDVVLAHEVGHVLHNHFREGDLRKFSTCIQHHYSPEEELADLLAGRVFANISYYHRKEKSSITAWGKLEDAFRDSLLVQDVSRKEIKARLLQLRKGFERSLLW